MTVGQREPFTSAGSKNTALKRGEKKSGRLSEAVSRDFLLLLEFVSFFSRSRIKALLNSFQNQRVWPCHAEKTLVLFISRLNLYLARC